MKIAVMGMGVAGSYLLSRLKDKHEVVGYERVAEKYHDSICAWGTCKNKMKELCDLSNIDFDKYVVHDGKDMHVAMRKQEFHIGLHGLCTYDKIGLIRDFMKGCDVRYGTPPPYEELEKNYDMIIDCTGFHRVYLPKVNDDFFVPTYEYKVEYEEGKRPFDDFFIRPFPNMEGYFWFFPLGDRFAHIGAGDYRKKHVQKTDEFMKKHGGKVVKTVGRPIRLSPPSKCKPFYVGKVVGVGESIGTVYPMLGEGIIPSMECANIFIENMHDMKAYERAVDKHFDIYSKVFAFVYDKIHGKGNIIKHVGKLYSIFNYMKHNEERFGMEIHMKDLLKFARA